MTLSAQQSHNIEQAILQGRSIDAIKLYREAAHCDLAHAKAAVQAISDELRRSKPELFSQHTVGSDAGMATPNLSYLQLAVVIASGALIVATILYYFLVHDARSGRPYSITSSAEQSLDSPRQVTLPAGIDSRRFTAPLNKDVADDRFVPLYLAKINSEDYINRKSSNASRRHDNSLLERKIKAARSQLTAQRSAPANAIVSSIPRSTSRPTLNGVLEAGEWQGAAMLTSDGASTTRLYLKVVDSWLFIAADVPDELTAEGYDQLRLSFHAGLTDKLVNERLHIGRESGVTSIRQTDFHWQGEPPTTENEHWKKHPISDWGLYYYAYGTSSLHSGHRQYEVALHIGEAGLHPGVPFTFSAEVETDPLNDADGTFVERRYLGVFGSQTQPLWLQL